MIPPRLYLGRALRRSPQLRTFQRPSLGCRFITSTTSIPSQPPPPPTREITALQRTFQKLVNSPPPSVPLSSLHLALRSITHPNAPVRIAIYGPSAPLLQTILSTDAPPDLTHPHLLRYGPSTSHPPVQPGLTIVTAPIETLRTHNIELLLSPTLPADPLSPCFAATTTAGARTQEYPVHRAIFYAGAGSPGLESLLTHNPPTPTGTFLRALTLPGLPSSAESVHIIDPATPDTLTPLTTFLLSGTTPSKGHTLKPAALPLLKSLLSTAAAHPPTPTTASNKPDTPESLAAALAEWSTAAHTNLGESVARVEKATLQWYQLLYRADDITLNLRFTVNETFLRRAEQGWWMLLGRVKGAEMATAETQVATMEEAREYALQQVAGLHRAAQGLLGRFGVTVGSGAAFSGLMYAGGTGLYEAGSVSAVAVVLGWWWLVRGWGKVRGRFLGDVAEGGRERVRMAEEVVWGVMKRGLEMREVEVGNTEMKRMREVREALEAVKVIERDAKQEGLTRRQKRDRR